MPKLPSYDRSELYNAISSNSQMAYKRADARNAYTSAKHSTFLERRNIAYRERTTQQFSEIGWTAVSSLISALVAGYTGNFTPFIGKELNSLIQQGQSSEANVDLLGWITEGKGIADASVRDGSSSFTEDKDDDGNSILRFNPSDAFSSWYEDTMKKIDESKYLPNVKNAMKESLATNYYKMVQGMQASAIEQSFQNIEDGYAIQLEAALIPDAQLYAQYDGKPPADQGIYYQGFSVIASRQDWDEKTKAMQGAAYALQVQRAGIQEKAVQIATGVSSFEGETGVLAANRYIYSQKSLDSDSKISISSKASEAYQQIETGFVTETETMMSSAFTDPGGSSPMDVYSWIDDIAAAEGLPESMVTKMKDTAKEEQRTAVKEMGANTLQQDMNGGLSALMDGRAYIAGGNANAYFYGIPEEKDALIARYDAAIQEAKTKAAEDLDTSLENIEEMDKKVIDAFNDANDYAYTLFDSGAITGRQYGQMITSNAQAALGESQDKDLVVLNGWNTAFSKATDAYVEDVYADEVKSKVEALLVAEGKINATKNKRTTEELRLLNDLVAETNGSILNALWDYGKKAVPIDSVLDYADKAYQSFVLKESVLGGDGESNIPLPTDDGVTMKGVISAAVDSNKKIISNPEASYVWYDHPEAYAQGISAASDDNGQITLAETPATPSVRFLDMNVEEEYRRTAGVYRSQLAMALGINESEIADNPEAVGENAAIASPVFSTRDGRTFRCRGYVLQEFIDTGTPGDGKGRWEPFASIQRDGSEPVLLRDDAAGPGQAADDTGAEAGSSAANHSGPLTISNESITGFIHVKTRDGGSSGPITGVEIDPVLISASNYTRQDIQRYILSADWGDGIRAQQVWRFVQPQLNRLEEEKRSR